jgi:hypothetical protein
MTDKISESLGLTPIEEFKEVEVLDKEEQGAEYTVETASEADYEYVRNNLKEIIDGGAQSLAVLQSLAEASENQKVYETLAAFMKTVVEANRELIDLDTRKKERFKNEKVEKQGSHQTNNIMLAGTTADLKRLVDQMREKDNND